LKPIRKTSSAAFFSLLLLGGCASPGRPGAESGRYGGRAGLVSRAEELVAGFEILSDKLFPTTGLSGQAELSALLRESGGPGDEFTAMILGETARPVLYARESIRLSIADGGFLNIHSAPASSFAVSVASRNQVEASLADMALEKYAALPPYLKPKYGILLPAPGSKLGAPAIAKWYGTDAYVIRLGRVKSRLTWTPGDSLDRLAKWASLNSPGWSKGEALSPPGWDLAFIPWSRRALIIPLMAGDAAASGVFGFASTPEVPFYHPAAKVKTIFPGPNASYLEIQIWGPLDLADVEEFIFGKNPPEAEFLKILKKYRIPVFDGRSGKPVRWLSLLRPGGAGLLVYRDCRGGCALFSV